MIFMPLIVGIVAAFAIFFACTSGGMKPPEASGVTALVLTVAKLIFDAFDKWSQFRETVTATMSASFVREGIGAKGFNEGKFNDYIEITLTVFNPCEFQIPIKSVELRFVPADLPVEVKAAAPIEAIQCKWKFFIPPKSEDDKTKTSTLLEKRHSEDFVLKEPVGHLKEHVLAAAPETLWIAVYSHAKEVARIDGRQVMAKLAPLLK